MTKDQCRICLENGIMKSIFLKDDKLMISTKLMCLAKVHIYPGDGLPSTICPNCLCKLNSCLEFIHLCQVSDLKLRANLKLHVDQTSSCKSELLNDDTISYNDDPDNESLKIKQDKNNYEIVDKDKKTIHKLSCSSISNIKYKSRKLNIEKKIEKQQCFTCGKVMSSKFRLKTHLRTHTGERPFSCPHCNKNFSLAQNLKVHIRTHTGEKPLQCTICGESFAQSAGLAAHKRKHTGQTPYRCVLCPRSFRTIGHLQYHIRFRLKTHLRTHTGERPFSCPHCNKNFSLAQNLKVHIRTHTGEKPLQCTICGESFAQSAGLAAHKRKHTGQTPYRCVLCPRSFRTIGHLQYHIRRHTGEKNFECDTCGHGFITRSDLKQHILTHTGDRPHVCSICGLRLTRASHLKRHVQHRHNGSEPINCIKCSITFESKIEYEEHRKQHSEIMKEI